MFVLATAYSLKLFKTSRFELSARLVSKQADRMGLDLLRCTLAKKQQRKKKAQAQKEKKTRMNEVISLDPEKKKHARIHEPGQVSGKTHLRKTRAQP